jgi:hypothetical protein
MFGFNPIELLVIGIVAVWMTTGRRGPPGPGMSAVPIQPTREPAQPPDVSKPKSVTND